eukprot:TRINITY_DN8689_c0_g1_i1.p1 TRINITY_DN8689_c0_g1~~TRINITY_DN8689_c0_g1_i1.p1  ORF type:complete len:200 (+),score=53.12 TRINITY_DN8689_c0_g1_i1:128-727(+)
MLANVRLGLSQPSSGALLALRRLAGSSMLASPVSVFPRRRNSSAAVANAATNTTAATPAHHTNQVFDIKSLKISSPYVLDSELTAPPTQLDYKIGVQRFLKQCLDVQDLGYGYEVVSSTSAANQSWLDFPQKKIWLEVSSNNNKHASLEIDLANWVLTLKSDKLTDNHRISSHWLLYFKSVQWPSSSPKAKEAFEDKKK